MTIGLKHLPTMTDRHIKLIIGKYGFNSILRKRTPIVQNPQACPCVADDDTFHQIDPQCLLCGGTGIIGGEAFRDSTIRMVMQPERELGFMGSSILYGGPGKMERIWNTCYILGDEPLDIGDFIIDSYDAPDGDITTIEYEIYDKQAWWLGQGPSRKRKNIYFKVLLRKTEFSKTGVTLENY